MTDTTARLAAPPHRRTPTALFAGMAVLTVALLALTNWMIVTQAPFGVKGIGASYLILYYHVPAAASMLLAYLFVGVAGVFYLVTRSPSWDRRGRAAAAVGLLANAVVLLTGSVWGKAAWNVWWRFDDPRLTISAVMFLIYLAYVVLARGIDDELKRPRVSAIYGIVAAPSYFFVTYSVKWFGQGSHPAKVELDEPGIRSTMLFAHLGFLAFYVLLYLWKYDLDALRDRADGALARTRRLEDARS